MTVEHCAPQEHLRGTMLLTDDIHGMTEHALNIELPKFAVKMRTLLRSTIAVSVLSVAATITLLFFIQEFAVFALIPAVILIFWSYQRIKSETNPDDERIEELRSWAAEVYDVALSTRNAVRLLTPNNFYDGKNKEMFTSDIAFLTNKGIFESRYQADTARLTYLNGRFILFNPETGKEYASKDDYIKFTKPVENFKSPTLLAEMFYPLNLAKLGKFGVKNKVVSTLSAIATLLDLLTVFALIMSLSDLITKGFNDEWSPWTFVLVASVFLSYILNVSKARKIRKLQEEQNDLSKEKKLFSLEGLYSAQSTPVYSGDDVYGQTQDWLLKRYGMEFTPAETRYLVDNIKDTLNYEPTTVQVNKEIPLSNGQSYITGVYLLQVEDDDFALMVQEAPLEVLRKNLVDMVDARIEAVKELRSNEKVYMLKNKHDEFYREMYQSKPVHFFWSDMTRAQLYSHNNAFSVVEMDLAEYFEEYLKEPEKNTLLCLNRDDVNYPITADEYRMLDRIAVGELDK